MEIFVTNLQKKTINQNLLKDQARKILRHEKIFEGELSLVLVSDQLIKRINQQFLAKNNPTDVLAFDLSSRPFLKSKTIIFGEIIISIDTAQRNAKIFKTSFRHELILYLVHGILHLLGFDDHGRDRIKAMRIKETQLMRLLKVR